MASYSPHRGAIRQTGAGAPQTTNLRAQKRRPTNAKYKECERTVEGPKPNLRCPEAVVGRDPAPCAGHRGASCHAARVQELHHPPHHIFPERLHGVAPPPHLPLPLPPLPLPPLPAPLPPHPLLRRPLPLPLRLRHAVASRGGRLRPVRGVGACVWGDCHWRVIDLLLAESAWWDRAVIASQLF